jgi:hypothetical protein
MKKFYVIYVIKDGVEKQAYIINDKDNDLDYHLSSFGDCYRYYEIFKSEKEALKVLNAFNKSWLNFVHTR